MKGGFFKGAAATAGMGRLCFMALLALTMVLGGGALTRSEAVQATYNLQLDSGTNLGGISTNWSEACGSAPPSGTFRIGLMNSSAPGCSTTSTTPRIGFLNTGAAAVPMMMVISDTPYAVGMDVTGVDILTGLRERTTAADYLFEIGYVSGSTFTPFGSYTYTGATTTASGHTVPLSTISGTAPAGSYLAVQVSSVNGDGSNDIRIYPNGIAAGYETILTVDEVVACSASAPTDLAAPTNGATAVELTWTADLVANDLGYDVYRNGVKLNGAAVMGGSYTDSTVSPSTAYNSPGYQVMGLASCGASPLSSGLPVTTPAIVNGTTVGALTYSGLSMASITVEANYTGDDNNTNTCTIIYSTSPTYSPYTTAPAPTRVGKSWVTTVGGLSESTLYYFRATFNDADAPAVTDVNADGSQSTTANLLMHNSANLGTKYWNAQGGWGVSGGQYGAFTCATCHQKNSANIKRIATTINGSAVSATDASVYGINNGTNGASQQACEVCHSQTSVHRKDMSVLGPVAHYGDSCTDCHKHKASFKPPTCNDCHDADAFGLGAPVVNASSSHVDADGVGGTYNAGDCENCHVGHYGKGGVDIPNNANAAVGINYGHGGIGLGGAGTVASISGKTTEAEICWGCHDTVGVSEWGTNTQPSTGNSPYNYGVLSGASTSNWTTATWSSSRSEYAYKSALIQSTHTANSTVTDANLTGSAYGYSETKNTVGQIRCSYCHDVHELAKATGDLAEGKPYLRGSWMGNPYEEDGAPRSSYANATYFTNLVYSGRTYGFGRVPRGSISQNKLGGYWIDQNNVEPMSATTAANGTAARNPTASWEPVDTNSETGGNATATSPAFAGLCLLCHGSGATTALKIDGLDQKSDAGGLWIGTNGHANSVKGGTGSTSANSSNIFDARGGVTTNTSDNPLMHYQGTSTPGNQSGSHGFRGSVSSGLRYTPYAGEYSTGGTYTRPYGYNQDEWVVDETGATKENQYHKFSCSKCHNPHASRLPKLMITNCLDTVHNTWDNQFPMSAVGTLNTNREVAQWTSAQNCHRYSESNNANTGSPEYRASRQASPAGSGAGWNKVTPWMSNSTTP